MPRLPQPQVNQILASTTISKCHSHLGPPGDNEQETQLLLW